MMFCFCFLWGVLIASLLELKLDWVYIYFSLFILFSSLIIFRENKKIRFCLISLFLIILGLTRYQLAFIKNEVKEEKSNFLVVVSAEPDVRLDGVRYIVQDKVNKNKYYFKSTLYPRYDYGDELEINCKLQIPKSSENFRYEMYLARYGVFFECKNVSKQLF